ncbi:MAG: transketolase [Actinobacteria bacterium]|nr:transketolase [Actinomycetota bacterium]
MEEVKLQRDLEEKARLIRKDIVEMMWYGQGGHVGGTLSIVDILTVLYFHVLHIDPKKPSWDDRDRVILSKGHAAAALYAILATKGYFPRKRLFDSFRICIDGILQEHPDMRKIPGIDMSSGSLGMGLSVGIGMAFGRKLMKKDFHIYVILGDGEIQEGQVWEAAMAAGHYRLNEITAILDYNRLQVNGFVDDILKIRPVRAKWEAFNWNVEEIDGHNITEIIAALDRVEKVKDKPSIIIAHTTKGKGVSFIENKIEWHSKDLTNEQKEKAIKELGF